MKKIKKRTQNKRKILNPLRTVLMSLGILAVVGGVGYGGYCAYTHYDSQNKEIKQLNTELDTTAKLLAENATNLKNKQSELASTKAEVESLTADKNALEVKASENATRIDTLTREKAELQTELEIVNARLETATTEQEQLMQDKANLRSEINDSNEHITTLESANERLRNQISELDAKVVSQNKIIVELEAKIASLQNEIDALQQGQGIDGYLITEVKKCFSLSMDNKELNCGYSFGDRTVSSGSYLRKALNGYCLGISVDDAIVLSNENEQITFFNHIDNYRLGLGDEPKGNITLNNVGEISIEDLDDNARYKSHIEIVELELWEGGYYIKNAVINYSITIVEE